MRAGGYANSTKGVLPASMSDADQHARLRWARSQRFRLTSRGLEADSEWRTTLSSVRSQGKTIYEAALSTWATTFKVQPDDASYLSELREKPVRLEDVAKALADTGASREHVKQALERLFEAGLMEPAPVA